MQEEYAHLNVTEQTYLFMEIPQIVILVHQFLLLIILAPIHLLDLITNVMTEIMLNKDHFISISAIISQIFRQELQIMNKEKIIVLDFGSKLILKIMNVTGLIQQD